MEDAAQHHHHHSGREQDKHEGKGTVHLSDKFRKLLRQNNAVLKFSLQSFHPQQSWLTLEQDSLSDFSQSRKLSLKIIQFHSLQAILTVIIRSMNKIISVKPHALELAREVLNIEASAVQALATRLDDNFLRALDLILKCTGRVIVSGMGKSGHIARKIAATFSSTGTPAYFVHPAEASHGDLGMITRDDVIIALSYSGESQELLAIVPAIKRQGAKLIGMTGNSSSTLSKLADVHLNAAVDKEACPMGLAPTASTTAALALGDALAVALLDAKGFGADDFARSHPGGSLGRKLLTHVHDIMRIDERLPMVSDTATLGDAILEISKKGVGMTAIVDANHCVLGIFTDGDLRRILGKKLDVNTTLISKVMSPNPRCISPDSLAVEAVQQMEQFNISQILIVDAHNKLVGALNMHDLLHAKVI